MAIQPDYAQLGALPEDDNKIKKISVKKLWIGIGIVVVTCLIILGVLHKKYHDLQKEDLNPYYKPMEKLRTALALGLRNHKIRDYQDSLKISDIVVKLPELLRKIEQEYSEEKRKYQTLYKSKMGGHGNWHVLGLNLYYISKDDERKTWHDAESFCMSRDAHLTSILSEEEQKYISSWQNGLAWIGLTDKDNEGIWKWTDGSRLEIQYWYDRNQNGFWLDGDKEEDCIFIDTSVSGPNWKDANCQELRRWICKESLQRQVPSVDQIPLA